MSTSTDDGSVEDKAARALAAAPAFLARSPVPTRSGGNKPTMTRTNGKDDVKVDNGLKRAAGGVDALKAKTLERSGSSTATSVTTNSASRADVRTRLEREFDDATVPQREDSSSVSVSVATTNALSKTTASAASTNDRAEIRGETVDRTESDVEEAAVTSPERVVVEMDGTKDGWTTSEDGRNDVATAGEGIMYFSPLC